MNVILLLSDYIHTPKYICWYL